MTSTQNSLDNVTSICEMTMSSMCDTITIAGYVIQSPDILPSCIGAAVIGIYGWKQIKQYPNITGSFIYSFTFLMLAFMMSDAGLTDCIFARDVSNPLLLLLITLVDVGLTSSIAMNFGFMGLIDLGWIDGNSRSTFMTMCLCDAGLFAAWLYEIIKGNMDAFYVLYIGVIFIFCGFYCFAQIVYLYRNKGRGIGWLLLAGFSGGIGLSCIAVPQIDIFLCEELGCHLAGDFWWFYSTDLAMYSCYRYWMTRVNNQENQGYQMLNQIEMGRSN